MRFQVWGLDFRAGKNLVGKSASNCVSRGCWFYSGRESVRFQGRRVRERASVGVWVFCGGILLASAPLGLSRCFWALGSGERACESMLECVLERVREKAAAARARRPLRSSGLKRWARFGPESTPGGLAGESAWTCLRGFALQ